MRKKKEFDPVRAKKRLKVIAIALGVMIVTLFYFKLQDAVKGNGAPKEVNEITKIMDNQLDSIIRNEFPPQSKVLLTREWEQYTVENDKQRKMRREKEYLELKLKDISNQKQLEKDEKQIHKLEEKYDEIKNQREYGRSVVIEMPNDTVMYASQVMDIQCKSSSLIFKTRQHKSYNPKDIIK